MTPALSQAEADLEKQVFPLGAALEAQDHQHKIGSFVSQRHRGPRGTEDPEAATAHPPVVWPKSGVGDVCACVRPCARASVSASGGESETGCLGRSLRLGGRAPGWGYSDSALSLRGLCVASPAGTGRTARFWGLRSGSGGTSVFTVRGAERRVLWTPSVDPGSLACRCGSWEAGLCLPGGEPPTPTCSFQAGPGCLRRSGPPRVDRAREEQ